MNAKRRCLGLEIAILQYQGVGPCSTKVKGTVTGLARYQSVPPQRHIFPRAASALSSAGVVSLRNDEKPPSRQLRRPYRANVANASAPAKATHYAIETAETR